MKYIPKIRGRRVRLMLSEQGVLAQWRRLVAFRKATNQLHWAMHAIVPPHRDGHQNGQESGHILHCRFVCCRPGGRRGDTERVVTRWWCLVAFMKALDLLHQGMCAVLYRHTAMAIKKACDGGAFFHCRRLFCLAQS